MGNLTFGVGAEAASEVGGFCDTVSCEVLVEGVDNVVVVESRAGAGSEIWSDTADKSGAII